MGPLPLRRRVGVLFLALVLLGSGGADAGTTSSYRRKLEATVEMPLDADVFRAPPRYNAPQQVHITLGDQWVMANEPGNSTVAYSEDPARMEHRVDGAHTCYDYFNYTFGFPQNLKHATKYYYAIGFGHTVRTFWFTTPPKSGPDVPFKFGLID